MSDIPERVKKIVVEHLGVDPEKVTDKASEGTRRTTENAKLIHSALKVCGSANARNQFPRP